MKLDPPLRRETSNGSGLAAECKVIPAVNHNVKPGARSDEGEGDAWPVAAQARSGRQHSGNGDGATSSVAKRVLERMDAFLHETN